MEEIIFGDDTGQEFVYDNKTYRNFIVLFYDESIHYKFKDVIMNLKNFKYYAYIKHNPETDEKVSHYHAFIRVDSATTESAIAKRLGIPIDKVRHVKNVRSSIRYLIHIDFENKIINILNNFFLSFNILKI